MERESVKLQSKNQGSGDSHFGQVNGAVFLLHHPLSRILVLFLVLFWFYFGVGFFFWSHYVLSLAYTFFPFGSNSRQGKYDINLLELMVFSHMAGSAIIIS